MRHDPRTWLLGQLPELVERGILDAAAAAALRRHYTPPPGGRARQRLLTLTFGVLGGGLIGSGLLLVLAHNWEELTRPVRAGLALGLLLVALTIACWAGLRRAASAAWTEGSAAFLALATLASITLVAQTYHLGGDLERHLLFSVALTVPVIYLLRSRVAGALVWIGATAWFLRGAWPAPPLSRGPVYVLLLAATLPYLIRLWRRSRWSTRTVLWNAVAGGSLLFALIRPANVGHLVLGLPLYAGVLAAYLGLDRAGGATAPPEAWRRPLGAVGLLGSGLLLWIGSFAEPWRETPALAGGETLDASGAAALALTLGLVGAAAVMAYRTWRDGERADALLLLTPVLCGAGWAISLAGGHATETMLAFNLFAFGTGLAFCVDGVRGDRLGRANAGLLLVAAVLAARFFDTEFSYLIRGVAFVVLGAGFLGLNLTMVARRRREVAP